MSDLGKQILDIGRQANDGGLSMEDARKALDDLGKTHHVSPKQIKKIARRETAKLDVELAHLQQQKDRLALGAEQMGKAKDALENDIDIPISERIRKFKFAFPEVWEEVALRIYKHVDSYRNYQAAYLEWGWAHQLQNWNLENGEDVTEAAQDALDVFELHKKHGFPFFFVSHGICEAAWQSDLKFAVDWKTMHLPFEAFTFVLPKTNPLGYDALIVYRLTKNGETEFTIVRLGKSAIGQDIVVGFPFTTTEGSESDVTRWVFNTIYAMSARPEYVEGGERVGRYKTTQSEVWTPNVIGRKYAIKRTAFPSEKTGSVRLHWRRGHFRQQAYGIGRTQHKTIWIEPMMVGGHE